MGRSRIQRSVRMLKPDVTVVIGCVSMDGLGEKGREGDRTLTVKEGSCVNTSAFNSVGKVPHLVKGLALCQSGDDANQEEDNM